MQLNPPLAAFTDLDNEHGTLDVNKCDDDDAPWIVAKREKDAEEREARAMMAKKSAEASLLKAEAAKRREKDLKAKESNRQRRESHAKEKAMIEERKRLAQRAEKKRKYAQDGMAAMREAKKAKGE